MWVDFRGVGTDRENWKESRKVERGNGKKKKEGQAEGVKKGVSEAD